MSKRDFIVQKSDLNNTRLIEGSAAELESGQVLVEVERFGLTTNNITYAVFGDALGYWSYFPAEDGWGTVPVWGFGRVVAARETDIGTGERLFGYFPMSSQTVLTPSEATPLCFADASAHRVALHPWYNRYYRCAVDPVYAETDIDVQPVLWALFMTGAMMAEQLADSADAVYISSASSKTALSLAWSLKHLGRKAEPFGITSSANLEFVQGLGVYSDVITYDDLRVDESVARTAYVDIAGNASVTSAAHVALSESLADSITIGATHRAPATEDLPMPGPAPRFFFIPDVAEAQAAKMGFEQYHQAFANAWHAFLPWAKEWLDIEFSQGSEAIEKGYRSALAGGTPPQRAQVFSW